MNKTQQWYNQTVGDDSVSAVARKARLAQPTLNRHVRAWELTAEEVIAIAHAYGTSAIKALIETGFLREDDADAYRRATAIETLTDRELADEVWKRMTEGRLDDNGEPAKPARLSVVEGNPVPGGEPLAALQSERNKEFEDRDGG